MPSFAIQHFVGNNFTGGLRLNETSSDGLYSGTHGIHSCRVLSPSTASLRTYIGHLEHSYIEGAIYSTVITVFTMHKPTRIQ